MCFVYFDEMTLKYLILSSLFRFQICFVLEKIFWTNTGSNCSKNPVDFYVLAICLDLNIWSPVKISENPHKMYFLQRILK